MIDTDRELTVAPAEEAAAPVSSAPIPVEVTRGTVFLAPELTVPMAMALATTLADTPATVVQVEAALVSVVLQPPPVGAVVGWDFTERGQIVPLTTENIARLVPWDEGGLALAEKANDLYLERYLRPFLPAGPTRSSPPMPMDHLTSATNGSGPKRAKGSSRSSRNGTAGKRRDG